MFKQINLEPLSTDQIRQSLTVAVDCKLEVFDSISSTNDYLLDLIKKNKVYAQGHAVLAEEQTAGRGRLGRKWESPFGKDIYLSLYHQFKDGYTAISGLSVAVGVVIAKVLKSIGLQDIAIKWPNDIYCNGRKLCGFLLETSKGNGNAVNVVIGIGINVAGAYLVEDKIEQVCTDIYSNLGEIKFLDAHIDYMTGDKDKMISDKDKTFDKNKTTDKNKVFVKNKTSAEKESKKIEEPLSRNYLAACVINEITTAIEQIKANGIAEFMQVWNELDFLKDKKIEVSVGEQKFTGAGRGVDVAGELCLLDEVDGRLRTFGLGSVRLI